MRFPKSALVVALLAATLAACGLGGNGADNQPTYNPAGNVLHIVGGSEQQTVFDHVVKPWCEQQKLECKLTPMGSVDQARLLEGDTSALPYDGFWFASKVFNQLGDKKDVLKDVQPMFSTPVVYAGWKSEMDRLGFTGRDVKIEEILQAVELSANNLLMCNGFLQNSIIFYDRLKSLP